MTFSDQIKKAWEDKRSTRVNLEQMGLAYDANEAVQIPNVKHEMVEEAKRKITGNEDPSDHENEEMNVTAAKSHVAEKLEAEAKAPRKRLLKLPKGQAHFLTYLLNKYGEDYEVRYSANSHRYLQGVADYLCILCAGNGERQEESLSINLEANTSQDKNV